MTTSAAPAATDVRRRPMGSIIAVVSLVLGPALLGLALATLHDPWNGDVPNYATIDNENGQLMLSFNLAAAAFPFLFGSVMALAVAARRSRLLAGSGLACSVLGLCAMLANAMFSMTLVLMYGIDDRAGLDQFAARRW